MMGKGKGYLCTIRTVYMHRLGCTPCWLAATQGEAFRTWHTNTQRLIIPAPDRNSKKVPLCYPNTPAERCKCCRWPTGSSHCNP